MKLHFAAASPFVRKVRMAAIELDLDKQMELVETPVAPGKSNTDYASTVNPLRKIPALVLSDGTVLFDSTVICEYLDGLDGQDRLFPSAGPARWQTLTEHALANGLLDASVSVRYETFLRPESYQWPIWIDDQWEKIGNGLAWFDERWNADDERMTISHIALACALGYLDFRSSDYAWREKYQALAAWHEHVAQRASYSATLPV